MTPPIPKIPAGVAKPAMTSAEKTRYAVGGTAVVLVALAAAVIFTRKSALGMLPNFSDPSQFGGPCEYGNWWIFHGAPPARRRAVRQFERKIIAWVRAGKPGARPRASDGQEEFLGDLIEACHTQLMKIRRPPTRR